MQETRGWDENAQATFSQRKKESSHDYRYFPEPDLPELRRSEVPEFADVILKKQLPTLPSEKRKIYMETYGLKSEYAEALVQNSFLRAMFEGVAKLSPENDPALIGLFGNYLFSDIVGLLQNSDTAAYATGEFYKALFTLMKMTKENVVSSRGTKDILAEMFKNGGDPETIAKEKGLLQQSDEGALGAVVQKVIDANPQVAADYRAGKSAALQFLVGQGMKESKGAANPTVLRELFEKALKQ